ncbi:MAG: hypothetical protein H6709_19085 [Kofleriaceae bacterium]|nr:hypothetical protein [Kofleriaceae bacterium]
MRRRPSLRPRPSPRPRPRLSPEIEVAPAPAPAPAHRRNRPHEPVAAEAPPPSAADSLRAEQALLARATAALRDGDPAAALTALAEHARRFPDGVLVQERAATRVLALCASGDTARGVQERDAFLDRWPRSVHAARVGAACAP